MTLDELIAELVAINQDRGPSFVRDFEAVLAEIIQLRDPASIAALVPFLKENAPFEELMFSIVHAIEVFSDTDYVRELLRATATLWPRSPRWTTILYMRILNSETAGAELVRQLPAAPPNTKAAVCEIMDEINLQKAQPLEKIARVLTAAS
jgi:hypothetical protein